MSDEQVTAQDAEPVEAVEQPTPAAEAPAATETGAEALPEAPAAETDAEAPSATETGEEAPPEASADSEPGPAVSEVVEVGAIVQGQVQRITPYGAFLTLPNGKLGLVHISEIDRNYVKDVHDHLREGDTVQAKVRAIKEDGKIDLSIKALQDPEPRVERRRGTDPGFEQMLRKFMRQSEERQVDVKRSVMNKRK